MAVTNLDANQVIQHVFDEEAQALRTTGTGPDGTFPISADSPIPVTLSGSSNLDIVEQYNIASGDLTTSYFEVTAATSTDISKIAVYETTGETIELAIGGSGSEVTKMIIGPGCDQVLEAQIPSGSRIAVRTVGSNATDGSLILNLLGAV